MLLIAVIAGLLENYMLEKSKRVEQVKSMWFPLHINTSRYFGGWKKNPNSFSAYGSTLSSSFKNSTTDQTGF